MKRCESIRNVMLELGKMGGYVINPTCLQQYILKYLKEKHPKNKMNSIKAKNSSFVFGVLCNEYFLISQNRDPDKEDFFMTKDRWDKYNIKQGMIESSTSILQEIGLIEFWNEKNLKQNFGCIKMFKISLYKLFGIQSEIVKYR